MKEFTVPYSQSIEARVKQTAQLWKEFTKLSVSQKSLLLGERSAVKTFGYELATGEAVTEDRKEHFDVAFSLDDLSTSFETLNKVYAEASSALDFFESVRLLSEDLRGLASSFLTQLEEINVRINNNDLAFYLRFIHYYPGAQAGEIIGNPHLDNGGFTFHLYESTEGCESFDNDGNWKPLKVPNKQALVIPGFQLQYTSKGKIIALPHKIIANQITSNEGRVAIVCFVHDKSQPSYNKKKFGRLQEKIPGFNFQLSKSALQAYFSN